jgi:hypothetical protein
MHPRGPLLSEKERKELAARKLKQLEQELKEAEILLGLIRKHLERASAIEAELGIIDRRQ